MLYGVTLHQELRKLLPLMQAAGFSEVEVAPTKSRVPGLSILSFVPGSGRKS